VKINPAACYAREDIKLNNDEVMRRLGKFPRKDFWWQKISDTPVPIPNTEVKPDTIDDSSPEADCENRLPPE
jgi:hypothetical protein